MSLNINPSVAKTLNLSLPLSARAIRPSRLCLSQSLMASNRGTKRLPSNDADAGLLSRLTRTVSDSSIVAYTKGTASDAAYVTKKLLKSTGKAAWIAGTTFLILVVPLIIEMDREQQFTELEMQQQSLLGAPPVVSAQK